MEVATGVLGGLLGLVVIVFLIVLGILWIILPFAIFGVKDRLDTIIYELRKQNRA